MRESNADTVTGKVSSRVSARLHEHAISSEAVTSNTCLDMLGHVRGEALGNLMVSRGNEKIVGGDEDLTRPSLLQHTLCHPRITFLSHSTSHVSVSALAPSKSPLVSEYVLMFTALSYTNSRKMAPFSSLASASRR